MAGEDGVMMSDGDESGFSTKETTLYIWQMETIRMVLTWDTMLPLLLILFSFCFICQPTFSTTRFDQRLTAACHGRGPPLPFEIIYWSGAVDYSFFFSQLTFFLRLSVVVFFSFFFIHDVDSNHSALTVLYTRTIASNLIFSRV